MRRVLVFLSLLMGVVAPAVAQTAAAVNHPSGPAAPEFAGEPLVIEEFATVYRYAADGTGERSFHIRTRMQSQAAAQQFGVLSVSYAAASQAVEMGKIHVVHPDGTTVETAATDAQDQPAEVTRQAPFYSDLHVKQFPVRSLGVGDTLDYDAMVRTTKPEVPGQFWGAENFAQGVVVLQQTLELRVPAAMKVTVVSPAHKPAVTVEGAERVYRWEASQRKPTVGTDKQDADPGDGLPDVAWTTFAGWDAVGSWYRDLSQSRAEPTPEIKAKAAALTAGAATDQEKAERVYAFVAGQIRYIGVSFGVGRYQPHTAAEVLANGYGDCKDKHTLLQSLLAAEGIEAAPVLIGAGVKFDRDVPAPLAFNHLITQAKVNGKPVWLDATEEVAPYGALMQTLRDKDALVVPASGAPLLAKTPAVLPFAAEDHIKVDAKLDPAWKLTGHFDVTLRGDAELSMRWGLRRVTAAQWDQFGQNVSQFLGYGGTVSHFWTEKVDEPGQTLHYKYDYDRPDFGVASERTILSLLTPGLFSLLELQKKPSEPIELGGPRVENVRSAIELPAGYTVTLPAAIHVRANYGSYDVTYRMDGQTVVTEARLAVTAANVPADKWEEYNDFASQVRGSTEARLRLHMPGESAAAPETPVSESVPAGATGVENVEAHRLVVDAAERLHAGDRSGAQAKVDQAEKLNPNEPGLWALKGLLAAAGKNFAEAETDLRKEIAADPTNQAALAALGGVLSWEKKRPEAISTYQQLLKVKGGSDPAVVLPLSALLC